MPMMSWRWPRTPWGLVGYVVTQDLDRALNVSEEREVGMVGLNAGIVSDPATPFGGVDIWAGPGRRSPRHRRVPRIQVDQHADSTVSLPSVRCTTDAMPTGVNRALVTRSVSRRCTKRAGVNRSTFHENHSDMHELAASACTATFDD
jgi:Aldehyde dehydrogenase family